MDDHHLGYIKKVPQKTLVGTSIGQLLEMAPNPRSLGINVVLKVDNCSYLVSKNTNLELLKTIRNNEIIA
jgi:hypothetical protein